MFENDLEEIKYWIKENFEDYKEEKEKDKYIDLNYGQLTYFPTLEENFPHLEEELNEIIAYIDQMTDEYLSIYSPQSIWKYFLINHLLDIPEKHIHLFLAKIDSDPRTILEIGHKHLTEIIEETMMSLIKNHTISKSDLLSTEKKIKKINKMFGIINYPSFTLHIPISEKEIRVMF